MNIDISIDSKLLNSASRSSFTQIVQKLRKVGNGIAASFEPNARSYSLGSHHLRLGSLLGDRRGELHRRARFGSVNSTSLCSERNCRTSTVPLAVDSRINLSKRSTSRSCGLFLSLRSQL